MFVMTQLISKWMASKHVYSNSDYQHMFNDHNLRRPKTMMTSSNGNIFPAVGPLWGNSTVNGEFPHKCQWREALTFSLIFAWTNGWVNNWDAGDLKRHRAHYDVTLMIRMWHHLQSHSTSSVHSNIHFICQIFFEFCTPVMTGILRAKLWQIWQLSNTSRANEIPEDWVLVRYGRILSIVTGPKVCLHDDAIKWKHLPCYWSSVRGIHRSPVNSPHKGQWCRALMFSLICTWTSGWVNNRNACDLRRHRIHYDVTVMNWHNSFRCKLDFKVPL